MSDKLSVERERGHSIETSTWKLESNNHCCTLIDAPGSREYVRSLIAGAAQADAAVLVLDASPGSFEAGVAKDGQTREHGLIALTLGLRQIIVAVNKLDLLQGAAAQEQRFEDIKAEATKVFKRIGIPKVHNPPARIRPAWNLPHPWHPSSSPRTDPPGLPPPQPCGHPG